MATTTNYGWDTPDDTDLVKDGAAAIRTLGSSIDTTTKNLNPQTTTGAIAYRSATANVNTSLAIGTAGQVLAVNSGATAPEWKTIAAGGKVLQVISATTTTPTTVATTTYTDTTLTATITPSSATSKILALVNLYFEGQRSISNFYYKARLMRASTEIAAYDGIGVNTGGGLTIISDIFNLTYLDSPSTTSATTYKIQGAVQDTANSSTMTFQKYNFISSILLLEIGA
jgi:hypothetical protein